MNPRSTQPAPKERPENKPPNPTGISSIIPPDTASNTKEMLPDPKLGGQQKEYQSNNEPTQREGVTDCSGYSNYRPYIPGLRRQRSCAVRSGSGEEPSLTRNLEAAASTDYQSTFPADNSISPPTFSDNRGDGRRTRAPPLVAESSVSAQLSPEISCETQRVRRSTATSGSTKIPEMKPSGTLTEYDVEPARSDISRPMSAPNPEPVLLQIGGISYNSDASERIRCVLEKAPVGTRFQISGKVYELCGNKKARIVIDGKKNIGTGLSGKQRSVAYDDIDVETLGSWCSEQDMAPFRSNRLEVYISCLPANGSSGQKKFYSVEALLDTGADCTIITQSCLENFGIPWQRSEKFERVEWGNGAPVDFVGVAKIAMQWMKDGELKELRLQLRVVRKSECPLIFSHKFVTNFNLLKLTLFISPEQRPKRLLTPMTTVKKSSSESARDALLAKHKAKQTRDKEKEASEARKAKLRRELIEQGTSSQSTDSVQSSDVEN